MKIDLRDIPEAGLNIEGRLDPTAYDLPKEADILSWDDLVYNLFIQPMSEGEFLIRGKLKASLKVSCSRCLDPINQKLPEIAIDQLFDADPASESIDLTPIVREDIVLNLPMVFRCELDAQSKCPYSGKVYQETGDSFADIRRAETWGALDQFKEK